VLRAFKTKAFGRSLRKSGLSDSTLCKALAEMEAGLIEADLGGGVIKKRIALPGRGKSGGARVIVATNWKGYWFFLYLFTKNERANISDAELAALQGLAADLVRMSASDLDRAVSANVLQEICRGQ
jgi:hypothetical protein